MKRVQRDTPAKKNPQISTTGPNEAGTMAEQVFHHTLDSLYPLYAEWVKVNKGWAVRASLPDLKGWYEFLAWTKEVK